MIKTLNIEGQPLEVNSAQGWLFHYKEQFGHDILPDLLPLLDAALGAAAEIYDGDEDVNIFEKLDEDTVNRMIVALSSLEATTVINILWSMSKNAGNNIPHYEFINKYDPFPYDEITPALFMLIVNSSVSSKNSKRLLEKVPALSTLTQSWSQEPDEDLTLQA